MLEILGIRNVAKLVPTEDDEVPKDPITENMNAINLKPLKAFIYQDHEAHIKVHTSAMQDPLMQQMIGQNPNAQRISGALQAHVAEHLAFAYRARMEQAMGVTLPPPDMKMPESFEVELARVAAQAAEIVLGQSKTQVAAQQAQAAANDPITQIQKQELAIKQAEVERKAKKDALDAAAKADQIEVEKERIMAQAEIDGARIGLEAAKAREELTGKMEAEGVRLGVDIRRLLKEGKKPPTT